jgi:cytochrome o ubiquinol oxidase subunit 2
MNSFFIPALAGQIYAMPGMETKLQAVINKPGDFEGFSANYSGAGFSGMRFTFRGMSEDQFAQWVQQAKAGGPLDRDQYLELAHPSEAGPVRRYSSVAPGLFETIVDGCVRPDTVCLDDMAGPGTGAASNMPAAMGEHPMSTMTSAEGSTMHSSANGADGATVPAGRPR